MTLIRQRAQIIDLTTGAVDLAKGTFCIIDAQNSNTSVTIQTPTNGDIGQVITFLCQNWSSTNFTINFSGGYRLDATWQGPAGNKLKTIQFIRIGPVWVMLSATPDY